MRLAAVCALSSVVACSRNRIPPAPATPPAGSVEAIESITPGTVAGIVQDSFGRPLDQAVLVLENRRSAHTDVTGRFRFDNVHPGAHSLYVMHIGFTRATQTFTLEEGSAAAFVFRLNWSPVPIVEICTTEMRPSVIVRLPNVAGAIVAVAHGDSVKHFGQDAMREEPENGVRSVLVFWREATRGEGAGRFEVNVTAPGYRTWRTEVLVPSGTCHVTTQVITVQLGPEG